MSTYADGYRAHQRFTQHREAKVTNLLTVWSQDHVARGLVVKHWPKLAEAMAALEEVEG